MMCILCTPRPMYRSIYRPIDRHSIYRPSVGRYVDRHIGRVSVDISTDTSVECRSIYQPIHRSRGAQNTHDPKYFHANVTSSDSKRSRKGMVYIFFKCFLLDGNR